MAHPLLEVLPITLALALLGCAGAPPQEVSEGDGTEKQDTEPGEAEDDGPEAPDDGPQAPDGPEAPDDDDDDDDSGDGPEATDDEDEGPPGSPRTFSQRVLTDSPSFISDVVTPPDRDAVPGSRPTPLLEIGDPFLGQGPINEGWELPTGAVWNASLLVYGTLRSALQVFDDGIDDPRLQMPEPKRARSEWANRLDLFANLRLSATERFLFGIRPLDEENRGFSGYQFEPNDRDGPREAFDGDVTTLFFEGDFGEIFPNLDSADGRLLDWGFSIGRQPLLFQDGIMINGTMDAVGIVRNSLRFLPGSANTRITLLYARPDFVQASRRNGRRRDTFCVFTSTDFAATTMDVDFAYVSSRQGAGSGLFFGAGFTQRIGHFNTTVRYNLSVALNKEDGTVEDGSLLTGEVALDIGHHPLLPDFLYLNAFLGIDRYRSVFRGSENGTPIGRIGILYASPGIGRYGNILASQRGDTRSKAGHVLSQADRSGGFAFGYQMFLDDGRQTLIAEIAGRRSTADSVNNGALALGARYQIALGNRVVLLTETFVGMQEGIDPEVSAAGGRVEFLLKF